MLERLLLGLTRQERWGGLALAAENQAMKKQLLLLNSGRKRSPPLTTSDRFIFGFLALFIGEKRLQKGVPTSRPFIERTIGSVRREGLNDILFFNERDLQNKLEDFQKYFNETRAHSSLEMKTPQEKASETTINKKVVSLNNYRWEKHCGGLYQLPKSA
jgi:hypothetical protein